VQKVKVKSEISDDSQNSLSNVSSC
jgi:hypothetical protein